MTSNYSDYDEESPKSLEPTPSKADDNNSVGTHHSDSESDSDSRHEPRSPTSYRKLVFLVLVVAFFGLAFGLGFGLTAREEVITATENQAKTMGSEEVAADEPNTTVQDSVEENSELDTPEEKEKLPAFGDVGLGTGNKNQLSWPELVGLPAEEAKKILEDDEAGYFVVIVPPGGVTTKDLRWDRVFLFTNEEGYVERVPHPGR